MPDGTENWAQGRYETRSGLAMSLEGSQLHYIVEERDDNERRLDVALGLARQIERLLEAIPASSGRGAVGGRAHSTRMARAMTASLVDELEAIARTATSSGVA